MGCLKPSGGYPIQLCYSNTNTIPFELNFLVFGITKGPTHKYESYACVYD